MNILKKTFYKIRKKPYEELDSDNPYEKPKASIKEFFVNLGITRTVAWCTLFFLTFADILTLNDLFTGAEFDLDKTFAGIIAFTCALFLEGIPYIMGDGLNRLLDKRRKGRRGEKKKTWMWFLFGLFASIIIMAAIIFFRVEDILLSVDEEKTQLVEILSGTGLPTEKIRDVYMLLTFGLEDSDEIAANIYLAFQPILTSILAFLVSFAYLSSDSEARNRQIERNFKKKLQRAKLNSASNHRILERAKLDLLSDLGIDSENEKWANCSNDEFIREVFNTITFKVNKMAINGYVIAVNNYNSDVKAKIAEYLPVIAAKSNLPDRITGIDIQSIINIFDSRNKDIEKWDADAYVKKSSEMLKKVLFNEMIVEFKIDNNDGFVVNEGNVAAGKGSMPKKNVFHPGQDVTGSEIVGMRGRISEDDEEEAEMHYDDTVIPGAGYSYSESDGNEEENKFSSETEVDTKALPSEDYFVDQKEPMSYVSDLSEDNEDGPMEYDGDIFGKTVINNTIKNSSEETVNSADFNIPDEDGPMEYDGEF